MQMYSLAWLMSIALALGMIMVTILHQSAVEATKPKSTTEKANQGVQKGRGDSIAGGIEKPSRAKNRLPIDAVEGEHYWLLQKDEEGHCYSATFMIRRVIIVTEECEIVDVEKKKVKELDLMAKCGKQCADEGVKYKEDYKKLVSPAKAASCVQNKDSQIRTSVTADDAKWVPIAMKCSASCHCEIYNNISHIRMPSYKINNQLFELSPLKDATYWKFLTRRKLSDMHNDCHPAHVRENRVYKPGRNEEQSQWIPGPYTVEHIRIQCLPVTEKTICPSRRKKAPGRSKYTPGVCPPAGLLQQAPSTCLPLETLMRPDLPQQSETGVPEEVPNQTTGCYTMIFSPMSPGFGQDTCSGDIDDLTRCYASYFQSADPSSSLQPPSQETESMDELLREIGMLAQEVGGGPSTGDDSSQAKDDDKRKIALGYL